VVVANVIVNGVTDFRNIIRFPKMNKKVVTAFYLALNIAFSIMIVLLNKWLYVHTRFPNITLSMIHFFMTFVGLIVCEKLEDIDIKEMVFIAMTFCGFVVLTNLSLAHNTVGTYQVAKMLTTPCVIVMQMIFYRKRFSILVKLTLIPITLGVIINFYYDIQFNVIGTIYATLGVLVTSLYQVVRVAPLISYFLINTEVGIYIQILGICKCAIAIISFIVSYR